MPKREEMILRRRALALQKKGKLRDPDAYVYGTLAKIAERKKAAHAEDGRRL